jgi:ribose 5-phosphate isomerase A
MKRNAAKLALKYIHDDQIVGIGTGSTVNFLIEELAALKHKIAGAVSSSLETTKRLQAMQIQVLDFNAIDELPLYIDGADAYNELKQLVKGGGGALTREKILAYASKQFICMVDATKQPGVLGKFPIAIEVIPMARSHVARQITKLGGRPEYREHFTTDNGNIILDVFGWEIMQPIELETKLNQIPGVVCNGIFAVRPADVLIVGEENG